MKNSILLLFILLLTSCGSGGGGNEICNCYKIFLNGVKDNNIDLDSETASVDLKKTYDSLLEKNQVFKKCNSSHFSQGKFNLFCMMNDDCLDCEFLGKISEAGPLLYYDQ